MNHMNALPEEKIKAICNDYSLGMELDDVAAKHNVCYKTAWKYVHQRGLKIRGKRIYNHELLDAIEKDYYDGMMVKDIADKYETSYDAMCCAIRTYIEKRTDDHRGKATKVIKLKLDGSIVQEYESVKRASEDSEVGVKYIRWCCNGIKEQTKGYRYKWG